MALREAVIDPDSVGVLDEDPVSEGEGVKDGVTVRLGVWLAVAVVEAVPVAVCVPLCELVGVVLELRVLERVRVGVRLRVRLAVEAAEVVGELLRVAVPVFVALTRTRSGGNTTPRRMSPDGGEYTRAEPMALRR